jgi:hypothetical protein
MELLDKYGNIVEQFKLENIIAIHCYDDCKNPMFTPKYKLLEGRIIYDVYCQNNDLEKYSVKNYFLLAKEKELDEILIENFKRKWNTYSNKIKHGILHINNNTIVFGEDRKEIGKASIIKKMGIIQLQNESEEFLIGEKYPFIIKF